MSDLSALPASPSVPTEGHDAAVLALAYDDAWEVSLILRTAAAALEKGAAELDKMTRENGYAEGTCAWVNAEQEARRKRAEAFRRFARQTLDAAS